MSSKLNSNPICVYFIGAGPGDPELLTLKAQKIIKKAHILLYTGSLVPKSLLQECSPSATLQDSASLTLEDIKDIFFEAHKLNKTVARIHTGDPSIFGTLREEINLLIPNKIPFEIVPGITAAQAAAARAGISFTVPSLCQTLILTRLAGRTPVPALEQLHLLASHHTSLAIYLSGGFETKIKSELLQSGLAPTTPILCAHKVGLSEEKLVWTTLENLDLWDQEH
ncbi:MAG: cobalt-precorrin-4/precorrin-4 C(11)-methyltransferase, partial [Desulfovibrionaceae bacterium]|nr:cobalt-precorrin-4/precorrin-4 C(11)-methyltransferase [Desulfovibrionaceae bacterium]